MFQVIVCLFLCTVLAVAEIAEIKVNPLATIAADVRSIKHDDVQRQVIIDLAVPRRCNEPFFVVRLSGASLYKLKLEKHDHVKHWKNQYTHATYFFSYPELVDPGTYFLEVVVLFCVEIDSNNFATLCVESPQDGHNIVSMPYSFQIRTSKVTTTTDARPRWVLTSDKSSANFTQAMLPTRYQKICPSSWCESSPLGTAQHKLYDWVDAPPVEPLIQQLVSRVAATSKPVSVTGPDGIVLCFFGASHMRMLVEHAEKLAYRGLAFEYAWTAYPSTFKLEWIEQHQCSIVLVSYGQWPVGDRAYHNPYTASKYENEMRGVLAALKNTTVPVFLRSENYNALGAMYSACPPMDHRSVPIIDIVNGIVSKLASEHGFPYIDTNHIMGPLWDGAEDWGHPAGKVANAQLQFILHYVCTHLLTAPKLPVWNGIVLPTSGLVRFTGSQSVYLYKDNKMRAFPDGKTFMKMGFDFGDVMAVHENKRPLVEFGPDLPSL